MRVNRKKFGEKPCPVFVRSIAMEGGIGPVAGSSHHSLYYRMPGVKICSPMTPKEYKTYIKNLCEKMMYFMFLNIEDHIIIKKN